MELSDHPKGTRLTITVAAEHAGMHPAHFRRLIRRGIFPKPIRTAKGQPYLDPELLARISEILRTGVGENGEEVMFHRRKPRIQNRAAKPHRPPPPDPYLEKLAKALVSVGVPRDLTQPDRLRDMLSDLFDTERPPLETAVPAIMRCFRSK